MPSILSDLMLKQAYHKPEDDIAQSFYMPCLRRAHQYDRAVGFFNSSIYALSWPSLTTFVEKGGRIRLICSPVLSTEDSIALTEGYTSRIEALQSELVRQEFQKLMNSPATVKPARVLATLVAIGVIDFRIAWVGKVAGGLPKRLFHDKLGIFRDSVGNAVVFKGSMNETWPGLSVDGNLESIDVYLSWSSDSERKRVEDEQNYFGRLWRGEYPGVITVPLPEVAKDHIISAADTEHWRELVDEITIELAPLPADPGRPSADHSEMQAEPPLDTRTPMPHQVLALDNWRKQGRRGILKHATGSGKTFTALCAIQEAFELQEVVLVLVPSELLLKQWRDEIKSTFQHLDLKLLLCGGGNTGWSKDNLLRAWMRSSTNSSPRAVIATVQTATSSQFLSTCQGGQHILLVSDEVHRLGALQASQIFHLETGPRLGLSATPERSGDPTGTERILNYFEGVVPPPFTITDAIAAGTLTPYVYHVHQISLESDEQAEWQKLSLEIRRIYAQSRNSRQEEGEAEERLKRLLIRRARIVKGAREKVPMAISILMESWKHGERWLVYCDDQLQLQELRRHLHVPQCNVLEYHSNMAGDSEQTLALFGSSGGIVLSIRCLDEGVDIPAVSHALILASSKNPREYIQRRGRVLRKFPGKSLAHVHDVLVTPLFDPEEPPATAILEGEIGRAIEFGSHAINPSCIADLERLAIHHGVDWESLTTRGVEDDEVEDSNS